MKWKALLQLMGAQLQLTGALLQLTGALLQLMEELLQLTGALLQLLQLTHDFEHLVLQLTVTFQQISGKIASQCTNNSQAVNTYWLAFSLP